MTLLEKLNRFPPAVCRLAATPATTRELAKRAGLPRSTIHKISCLADWNTVTLEVIQAFSTACGVNLLAQKRPKQFLAGRSWKFLKEVRPTQRKLVQRLLTSVRASAK